MDNWQDKNIVAFHTVRWCAILLVACVIAATFDSACAVPPQDNNEVANSSVESARVIEGFEGVKPSWKFEESDHLAGVLHHRRVDVSPMAGRRSEHISVIGRRGGERIIVTHRIPPSAAIDEFQASVWVKGNRNGYQLRGRVRLPRSLDEHHQPHTVEILGERYTAAGMWQKLTLKDTPTKIRDAVRELRIRLSEPIDFNEAYLDQVSLNIYGAAGRNEIQIDDLALQAAVPVAPSSRQGQRSNVFAAAEAAAPHLSHRFQLGQFDIGNGGLAPIASSRYGWNDTRRNFVARAVVYHGESFEFLKELGFNTIWLSEPVSDDQLRRAHELGLWLLAPQQIDLSSSSLVHSAYGARLLAWTLNAAAMSGNRSVIENRLRSMKSLDPQKRPIIVNLGPGGGLEGLETIGLSDGLANPTSIPLGIDILVDQPPLGRNARARQRARSRSQHRQSRSRWVALGAPLVNSSRWLPLREQIWTSVHMGYDGFLLRSTTNLEQPDSRHARNLAELFNIELSFLSPWIQPDSMEADRIDTRYYNVRRLSDDHTDLILVSRKSTIESSTSRVTHARRYAGGNQHEIFVPSSNHRDVYLVEPGGLSPVNYRRVAGGLRISLNSSKPEGILLLTDRGAVVTRMTKHVRANGRRVVELMEQVIQAELVNLDRRLQGATLPGGRRNHLRSEVHQLHGRIAWLLEPSSQVNQQANGEAGSRSNAVGFRELDHVLGQLERVHQSLEIRR